MNWVDFVIVFIVVLFALEGLRQGFFHQVLNILGLAFSLIVALIFYSQAASLLLKIFNLPPVAANPIGFLLVWVTAESIFFGVVTRFLKSKIDKYKDTVINKTLGFLPAALNALLFLAFVLLFIVSLPLQPNLKQDIYNSRIGSALVAQATILEKPLNSIFGPITKQGLTFLTVKPEDKGSLDLKFTQRQLTIDYQSEQDMFTLVNHERELAGVKVLIWDENLAKVGRAHSRDMFERGYFSHYSLDGKDVGDRLLKNGIDYSYAGENLALAPNVQRAHTGLMNSTGHKRNILDPAFGHIGIGVIDGGVYGKMFTQVFTE